MRSSLVAAAVAAAAATVATPHADPWASLPPVAAHNLRRLTLSGDPNCPPQPSPQPFPQGQLPPSLQAVLAAVNATMASTVSALTPGAAVSLSYLGTPLLQAGYGIANTSSQMPVTATTPFRVASVSKMVVAMLLYVLEARGDVRLDDAIVQHVPGFSVLDPYEGSGGATITFRHLATHMSGLQREMPWGVNDTESALAAIAETMLILPPGTTPSYSNLGFALLGHILGEYVLDGTDFYTATQTYVLEPLGRTNSGWDYTPDVLARMAWGYMDGEPVPFTDVGWWSPAGSMYASVADLDAIAQALMAIAAGNKFNVLGITPTRMRGIFGPEYNTPDQLSGFGAPWERRQHANYSVLNKGTLPPLAHALRVRSLCAAPTCPASSQAATSLATPHSSPWYPSSAYRFVPHGMASQSASLTRAMSSGA